MIKTIAATAVLLVAGAAGAAANQPLDGDAIRKEIAGKRVMLETRWGGFPMRYASSGQVTGDGTALGLGRFFAPKETGKWWVAGDQLCQQFPTWYDGRRFCFTLKKTGEGRLIWQRDDGRSGTARISG